MKKITLFFIVFVFFGSIAFAEAQTDSVRAYINDQKIQAQQIKAEMQETRQEFRDTVSTTRANMQNKIQVQRVDIQERLQNAANPEERKAILMEAKETREQVKANIAETRSDLKAKGTEMLDQRMDLIVKKFKAFIERGRSVATRINTKLDELSNNGVDVSVEKEMYTKAESLISQADNKVDEAAAAYAQIDMNLDRAQIAEEMRKVKALLQESRESLQEAYQTLREIVQSLKQRKDVTQKTATVTSDNPNTY